MICSNYVAGLMYEAATGATIATEEQCIKTN